MYSAIMMVMIMMKIECMFSADINNESLCCLGIKRLSQNEPLVILIKYSRKVSLADEALREKLPF